MSLKTFANPKAGHSSVLEHGTGARGGSNSKDSNQQSGKKLGSILGGKKTVTTNSEVASNPSGITNLDRIVANPQLNRYTFWGTKVQATLSKRDIVQLTSQLAIMTRSGVDIVSALEALARQSRKPDTIEILSIIHHDVSSGSTFSAALSKHERIFGSSYIASVTAGEASGKMWDVLDQLARLQRSSLKLSNTLRTLSAYPLALLAVSLLVIAALVLFVLPQFAEVFAKFDTPLPWATQLLISFSSELRTRFWLWIPLALAVFGGGYAFICHPFGSRLKDRLLLTVPVVGEITQCLCIGQVCRLLGLLVQSGVPLLESLELVRKSVKNTYYREMIAALAENVTSGHGLGTTLIDSAYVPPSASEMILTAERTGSLGNSSTLIGDHFEDDGEERLRAFIVVLEPAVTIVMGAIVAFVVLAVALPMFDLSSAVQN